MFSNPAVVYSFCLYVLYVLLPLIPAVLIFRLFPDTKVTVSGPLQNLTVNATGAFAAYVVTVALGFFLVQNVEAQIRSTRLYPVEGVIVDLGENQYIDSDRFYSKWTTVNPNGKFPSRDYYFVILLNHPVEATESFSLKYWELSAPGGTGMPPPPRILHLQVSPASSSLQRFRLKGEDVVAESD